MASELTKALRDGLELEPIRRTKVYAEVASQIHRLIAEGHLEPGDRLPPERELAETFGVSRTSVRDAIRVLEMRGLVEPRHGEGTLVKQVPVDAIVSRLADRVRIREIAIAEDNAFHYRIAVAAKNQVVLRVMDVVMDLLKESRARSLQ